MKQLPLSQGKFALVDDLDYEVLSKHKWYLKKSHPNNKSFYGAGYINSKPVYLHRFIMNPPEGMVIDHIDGDGLNCQRNNMRICSVQENNRNLGIQSRNRSGYKGVSWNKKNKKWQSHIRTNGKTIYLGLFVEIEKANQAYLEAAKTYHGEFARGCK